MSEPGLIDGLAKSLNIELLELKYALALFSIFPLAYVHRRMRDVQLKHVYSIFLGVCLGYFMFGT